MPDFERITDKIARDIAESPERAIWIDGWIAGKRRARLEVLAIVVLLYFGIALYGYLFAT